ncbi:hypothetical protein BHYA_0321g00020 [Botrytis hyacinthi]|uniref:Uncharacterized protein n=1 Tax=Botrytis hyacinthi TaxID=278943 RepID=A0A4Z1G617_9HELO|nr:hypothetical protein BHYA_0321g00020 [Botrytis hyacinthi]
MRGGKQTNAMSNFKNLLSLSDEKEATLNPTSQSPRSSVDCETISTILEMVKRTHPERQMQSNALIAGKFLPEVIAPIDTTKKLVKTIAYLTRKLLPTEYVEDFLKEIVSENLRSEYTRDEIIAIYNDCRELEGLPQAIFLQLLSPIYTPTHFTSKIISVPSTNDSDNHKGFIERYQITFKNETLVPAEDCEWLQYHDNELGLKFLCNNGSGHQNTRIGSGFMVILEVRHQWIIGISSMNRQPITLDLLAVKSACYQLFTSDRSIDPVAVLRMLQAIDRSFQSFSVRLDTHFFSIDHTYLQLASLVGEKMALCCGQPLSTVGKVTGVWPGLDCSIYLAFGKCPTEWLDLFKFRKEWKIMTLQDRIAELEGNGVPKIIV